MDFTEHRYRILIVSSDDRFGREVSTLLQGDQFQQDFSRSASDARCKLLENQYDFVIVNAPLRDEFGSRLCIDISRNNGTIAAIFAATDTYDEIYAKVTAAAEVLGITEYLLRKPRALSGGQRQRVAIGRAMVRDSKVFLMDEPLSNLDAKLRNQMRAEIILLRQKLDTTFIYVTHDQTEAMTLGDRKREYVFVFLGQLT